MLRPSLSDKVKNMFKQSNRVAITGKLLAVELVSNSITDAMISEFGICKTVQAIQSLYDADLLTESEALAMLESVNSYLLNEFARYSDEQFTPVTLY